MTKKLWLILGALLFIGLIVAAAIWWRVDNPKDEPAAGTSQQSGQSDRSTPQFNKQLYSIDNASSLWAIVNKGRALPSSYVPIQLVTPNVALRLKAGSQAMYLRAEAATALGQLAAAASAENIKLMLASGYRSYNLQIAIYDSEVNAYGRAQADRESARPGHSEHQTGLATDMEPASRKCEVQQCFADTLEGKWLAANAYRFGFIIRYPKDGENLTGYKYEPWHLRYVGIDLATELQKTSQTLEQFFDLPAHTSYPEKIFQLQ